MSGSFKKGETLRFADYIGMSKANLYNKHILAKNMFAKILRKEVRYV